MSTQLKNLLPGDYFDVFLSIGKEKTMQTGDCFIHAGETPVQVAFVKKGLFRYVYVNGKGDEFTKAIMPVNNFISSYSAMVQERQSYFSIEALEPSVLIEFRWADFMKLFEKDVFWLKFLLKFIEKGYIIKEKRERDLLLLDAETRYKNFLTEFPGLDQRITQGIIASYLGIQPETLSRIRKKIVF